MLGNQILVSIKSWRIHIYRKSIPNTCYIVLHTSLVPNKKMRFKAKKIHGIVEALTFLSISVTCSIILLRTSLSQESLPKHSTCVGGASTKG